MIASAALYALLWVAAPEVEVWAGHAIVTGERAVPILGKVEARTESFVLAKVTKTAESITIEQTSCAIELGNPLGVKLSLNPGAAPRLPAIVLKFKKRPDGTWVEGPSESGWREEDVDGDGHKGMTVNVEAPICGGKLYVGVQTKTASRGTIFPDGTMRGQMKSKVNQVVHGTEGACIKMLADSAEEAANGTFAYVPAAKDATCGTWQVKDWPIKAK